MKYAYIRVSTKEQNFARQVEAIRNYAPDLRDEDIFADKESGKDFNRTNYMRLKETVQAGDEVIVKELDRFGRNKEEDKKEIEWFKRQGVCLRILDIPSTKIKTRQREGIDAMPVVNGKRVSAKAGKAGRGFGPVPKEVSGIDEVLKEYHDGELSVTACCERLGVSRSWWYRNIEGGSYGRRA